MLPVAWRIEESGQSGMHARRRAYSHTHVSVSKWFYFVIFRTIAYLWSCKIYTMFILNCLGSFHPNKMVHLKRTQFNRVQCTHSHQIRILGISQTKIIHSHIGRRSLFIFAVFFCCWPNVWAISLFSPFFFTLNIHF